MKLMLKVMLVMWITFIGPQLVYAFETDSMQKGVSAEGTNKILPAVSSLPGSGLSPAVTYNFVKDYYSWRFAFKGSLNSLSEASSSDDLLSNFIFTDGQKSGLFLVSGNHKFGELMTLYAGVALGASNSNYTQEDAAGLTTKIESNIITKKASVTMKMDSFHATYVYSKYSVSGVDSAIDFQKALDSSASHLINIYAPVEQNGQEIWFNAAGSKLEGGDWQFSFGIKTSIDILL